MAAYNKRTALHLAAERGNLQCCKVLLAAGAHIDAQDSLGCTPIYNAAIKGQAGIVRAKGYILQHHHVEPQNGGLSQRCDSFDLHHICDEVINAKLLQNLLKLTRKIFVNLHL
jgi:ankyrin repeat protein